MLRPTCSKSHYGRAYSLEELMEAAFDLELLMRSHPKGRGNFSHLPTVQQTQRWGLILMLPCDSQLYGSSCIRREYQSRILFLFVYSGPYVWWNVPAVMARGYGCSRNKERRAATIIFNHPWHISALIVPLNLNTHTHTHAAEFRAAVLEHHLSVWCQVALVSSDYGSSCCLRWPVDQLTHVEAPGQAIWSVGHKEAPRGGVFPPLLQDRAGRSHAVCLGLSTEMSQPKLIWRQRTWQEWFRGSKRKSKERRRKEQRFPNVPLLNHLRWNG